MPFKSDKQRKYLEMIAHNPASAVKPAKDVASIKNFVADAEKAPQPKKPKKFNLLMNKLGSGNA